MNARPTQRTFAGVAEDDVFTLSALLQIFWKWSLVILLVVGMVTGTVIGVTLVQPPQYEASIEMIIGQEGGITETPQNAPALLNLPATMAEAINSRRVAEAVIQQANLQMTSGQLLANLSTEQIPDTLMVEVTYKDSNPKTAERVVETVGRVFSNEISKTTPKGSTISATVWDHATVSHVGPNPARQGFLALVFGIMLGVGLAFLLEYFDDRLQSSEEAELASGVSTLGIIPEFKISQSRKRKG